MAKSQDKLMAKRKETKDEPKLSLFHELYSVVEDAKTNMGTWAEKANNYYRLRMRTKKTKTFPFPGCCFSEDTEVLTHAGWKPVKEVGLGDKVYSMNPKDGIASYQRVDKLWDFPAQELISIKSHSLDFLVTPNHNMLVNTQGNEEMKFVRADALNTAHKIPLTSLWAGKTVEYIDRYDAVDFCRFLGWYISEGFTYESGTIGICQSEVNITKREQIMELLDRMGLSYSIRSESFLVSCKGFSQATRELLVSLGQAHEKFIPRFILDLNGDCLKALLETMVLGDGSIKFVEHYSPEVTYYTSSKQLADDVQELAQKVGLRARIGIRNRIGCLVGVGYEINEGVVRHLGYEVHLLSRSRAKVSRATIEKVSYAGNVYCPETPFHTLYVRRNGIAAWSGNSNLRLPTIETNIRKTKASLMALYTNVKPRVMVVPQNPQMLEHANKIEQFLDWLADVKIKMQNKLAVAADIMLQQGLSLVKVSWRMEETAYIETIKLDELSVEEANLIFDARVPDEALLEFLIAKFDVDMSETVAMDNIEAITEAISQLRSGKAEVKVKLKDELYNAPDITPCDPTYVYVPADAGIDVQSLRFIGHEYHEPYDSLKHKAKTGAIDKDAFSEIDMYRDIDLRDVKNVQFTKDMREGIDRLNNPSNMVKLIDLYKYHDLDKDGIAEKCHFLLAPDFHVVLKKQRLENDSQQWPFVRFATEITDDRWFSARGFPEHLEDLSKEIDAQHNQKIDNQTIRNAPLFVFRSGIINPRLVKFIPGQGIPVPGTTPLDDAVKIMQNQNTNVEFSYEREEMILKGTIQEYIGQIDYSVQSMINKRQPRTLGEVQMQAQSANMVFSLDASMFANSIAEIFTHMLDLCQQYMPERVFAMVVGTDGMAALNISRDEIQGKYHIICRGNDITSNPQLRLQKALSRIQVLLSPAVMQSGVVTPPNIYNIMKYYLQYDSEMAWREMISMPPPPPPPIPAPETKVEFEELTDMEQAQILQSRGLQPDVTGRRLRSKAIIQEKDVDQKSKQVDNLVKIGKLYEEEKQKAGK